MRTVRGKALETDYVVNKPSAFKGAEVSALSVEDKSMLWRIIRIGVYFLVITAVFAYIYFSTKTLRESFVAAEQENDENNQYTVTDLASGGMLVNVIE